MLALQAAASTRARSRASRGVRRGSRKNRVRAGPDSASASLSARVTRKSGGRPSSSPPQNAAAAASSSTAGPAPTSSPARSSPRSSSSSSSSAAGQAAAPGVSSGASRFSALASAPSAGGLVADGEWPLRPDRLGPGGLSADAVSAAAGVSAAADSAWLAAQKGTVRSRARRRRARRAQTMPTEEAVVGARPSPVCGSRAHRDVEEAALMAWFHQGTDPMGQFGAVAPDGNDPGLADKSAAAAAISARELRTRAVRSKAVGTARGKVVRAPMAGKGSLVGDDGMHDPLGAGIDTSLVPLMLRSSLVDGAGGGHIATRRFMQSALEEGVAASHAFKDAGSLFGQVHSAPASGRGTTGGEGVEEGSARVQASALSDRLRRARNAQRLVQRETVSLGAAMREDALAEQRGDSDIIGDWRESAADGITRSAAPSLGGPRAAAAALPARSMDERGLVEATRRGAMPPPLLGAGGM